MPITEETTPKVAIAELTDLQMLEILKKTKCYCGNYKKSMMSHCRPCYYDLPPEMKKALYRRCGFGYEEAFRASLELLAADTRFK